VQIRLTGRHIDVSDELRDYVEEKVRKLDKYYDRIHEVEVIMDQESEQLSVELIVRAGQKHTFVASEVGPEPAALIDMLVDKMERQLTRHKEKNRNHKGGTPADGHAA